MFKEFLRVHEINILLLQEVTHLILQDLPGWDIHYNIGTLRKVKAIVAREGIRLENIMRLRSDRTIGARFRETWIMNL